MRRFGIVIYVMCFIFGAILMFFFMGFSMGMFESVDPVSGGVADFCKVECEKVIPVVASTSPSYDSNKKTFSCACFGLHDEFETLDGFSLKK